MAKLYGEIAASAVMTFDKSFARANGQPLDLTEIYYSLAAAEEYAAGAGAYVGQKIVVIENNVITHYSIEDEAGTLKELGSKPIGDGDTISVAEDGTISLAGLGEEQATGTWNAVLIDGKLTWVEPSATTVEGLDTRLQALESEVGDAATDITAATGLYLAIADGIQEAKDYADANDADTTYTLKYITEDEVSVEGKLVGDGTTLVTLNNLTIPDNADEIRISNDVQAEVVSFNSSSVKFITPTAPTTSTTYQVTFYANGLPTDGVEVLYFGNGSIAEVYDIEGVEIPSNATEVSCDLTGTVIWNQGDSTVKFAGNYVDNLNVIVTYTIPNKAIRLVDNKGTTISSIDATPFIKDGMLNDVEYDETSNTLTFTWNTDSGLTSDTVVLSDILDPYTAGNGIEISNNVISAKVDETSEDYLSIGADGIKVSGIDDAISTEVSSETSRAEAAETALDERLAILEAIDHDQYATNDALKEVTTTLTEVATTANNASTKVETLEDKIDEITSVGGEPNIIEYIQVNNNTLTPTDKTVNIILQQNGTALTVENGAINILTPTKISDLSDGSILAELVNEHTETIEDLTTRVTNNENAIALLTIKSVDDVTIQNNGGTISVKAISTDLLTQGENELILNGGSAV